MSLSYKQIRSIVASNSSALFVTTGISMVLKLGGNLILARLLVPDDFAISGLIGSVLFMVSLLSDVGFKTYIVRHQNGSDHVLLDTIWTIRIIRGIALTLVVVLLSGTLSEFLSVPLLANPLAVCAFVFILQSLGSMGPITTERDNKVSKPLWINTWVKLVVTLIVILSAYILKSFWAFVIGMIVERLITIVVSYWLYTDSARALRLDRKYLREFWSFSKIIIASSLVTIVLVQGDRMLLTKLLPLSELGLYFVALGMNEIFIKLISRYSNSIFYPYVSSIIRSDSGSLRESVYHKKTLILLVAASGCGALAGFSEPIIDLLYPEEYQLASLYLSILLVRPLTMCVAGPAEYLLIAYGKTNVILTANILRLVWVCIGGVILYHYYGALGVLVAFASMEVLAGIYMSICLARLNLFLIFREILILGAGAVSWVILSTLANYV